MNLIFCPLSNPASLAQLVEQLAEVQEVPGLNLTWKHFFYLILYVYLYEKLIHKIILSFSILMHEIILCIGIFYAGHLY